MKWHHYAGPQRIEAGYEPVKKYLRPGRPRPDAPARTVFKVAAELVEQTEVIKQARRWKGRFILVTNDLDEAGLSDEQMLTPP
jgi:hypothetical protein